MASPQAGRILALSVLGGLVAGGILATVSLIIVRPYTNAITDLVIDELVADGEFEEEEFDSQLQSIYQSQTLGSLAGGAAAGALIGGTYIAGRRFDAPLRRAIIIAGIAWFVLYAVPSVKYPPSPLIFFYSEAASSFYPLSIAYTAVSGLAALGIVIGFRKMSRKNKIFGMAAAYLVIVAIAFVFFPEYDPDSSYPQALINAWSSSVSAAMTVFWFSAGIICGVLLRFLGKTGKLDPNVAS
jgi:MFS family permease